MNMKKLGNLKLGQSLDEKLNYTLVRFENYPNIKANTQFLNLQENLSRIENQIQAARRIYNADVTVYNTLICSFPTNVFSKIFSFKEEELLNFTEAHKNVNIEF